MPFKCIYMHVLVLLEMFAPRRIVLFKAKHPLVNYESLRNLSKRVVVTGLGIVSSVGCNMVDAWKNIRECRSGIKHLGKKLFVRKIVKML